MRRWERHLARSKVALFLLINLVALLGGKYIALMTIFKIEVFGDAIKKQLAQIGLAVTTRFSSPHELGFQILSGKSDFFFFGWRNDLGDASDFLTAVVHRRAGDLGHFNGRNYSNSEVDRLIEESVATVEQDVRLLKMREAMKIITEDDIIGVPLFSPDVLYAVSNKLSWKPRVDGFILASEVKM